MGKSKTGGQSGQGKFSVEVQCEKTFRNANAGSYGTQARYESSCLDFSRYCAEAFKLQNLKNIQDKHVASYVEHRQQEGISPKTIKNDLSAIRYMHGQINGARHELSGNKELKEKLDIRLEVTPTLTGDRSWDKKEYQNALEHAGERIRNALQVAREMGLRVSEVACMRRHQAVEALKTGEYHVGNEAKGGRPRTVPINERAREVLQRLVNHTKPGERVFVDRGKKAHLVRQEFERELMKLRNKIETQEGQQKRNGKKLTWHGVRFTYSQERFKELVDRYLQQGYTVLDAEQKAKEILTRELGHNRTDVLAIYLQGLRKKEKKEENSNRKIITAP